MEQCFFSFLNRVKEKKGIRIICNDKKVVENIYKNSYSYSYGARSIKRYIEKRIGDVISKGIVYDYFDCIFDYFLIFEEKSNEFIIKKQ